MSKYSNFQSLSELQSRRDKANEARVLILQKAKEKYEREERKKEKAKKQGEGTWMLDAVSQRIQKEERALEKVKKEKKKKKKEKKKKKKKKERNDSSSSSDEDEDEERWVEAASSARSADDVPSKVQGPQLQRESWMEAPIDLLPSISRKEIREAAQKEKDQAKKEAERLSAPGQHARELNPYWRDGGTGLPEEQKQKQTSARPALGDGGLSWLRKAYQRCKEQANDEGRSLEDVAAERWGSLNHLKSLIEKAEKKQGTGREATHGEKDKSERSGERDRREDRYGSKRGQEGGRDKEGRSGGERGRYYREDRFRGDSYRERDAQEKDDRNRGDHRYHDRLKERDSRREGRHYDDEVGKRRSREINESRSSNSNSRAKFHRPHSDEDDDERFERKSSSSLSSRFRKPDEEDDDDDVVEERNRGGRGGRFMRPQDSDGRSFGSNSRKFSKPGDSDEDSPPRRSSERKLEIGATSKGDSSWRKQSADVPRWRRAGPGSDNHGRERERDERDNMKRRSRKSSTSSSADSSSSSSDKGSVRGGNEREKDDEEELSSDGGGATPSAPAKVLSEEELNDLAAKILRAEIMGEEALAAELKNKLENARRLRDAAKSGGEGTDFAHRRRNVRSKTGKESDEEDDNVVVLSRSSKGGMVRPVAGASEEWGSSGGRKRKRKNVTTHGDLGERKKFFHDDDKFDLKTLVEREKAGTAEDQNSMFARLAGRAGDRDLDVDDMFVSKAARNQEEEQATNRDRMAAIFEHRKMSKAMENCQRCFNKVPKHLIIAIGSKSYLCLPPHRSLTEGHCLIVPMAHVSSATGMDEDVWQEIQLFRKSLVQMFTAQDLDVVVMETVMHLKHFPHAAIECIPLEREVGDLAPIYFKKAIQEAGPEWSDNKKLHDISRKDVRHVIPKGFPYFSVDFGLQGGFAHVIEDEAKFPHYFGREIVGGMLDTEPSLWRKPHKQSFEDQRQKILQFEKWWSPFDWTRDLNKDD